MSSVPSRAEGAAKSRYAERKYYSCHLRGIDVVNDDEDMIDVANVQSP